MGTGPPVTERSEAEPEQSFQSQGKGPRTFRLGVGRDQYQLMSRPCGGSRTPPWGAFGRRREPASRSTTDGALPRCWSQVRVPAPRRRGRARCPRGVERGTETSASGDVWELPDLVSRRRRVGAERVL